MILKLIRTYFKLSSAVAPKRTGKLGFKMFQKVRIKKIRERERQFFDRAQKSTIPFKKEPLEIFELGNPEGQLVVLVHGWESNAGCMSKISDELVAANYRVVTFNLPGHAWYKSSHTNLLECYTALLTVLEELNPSEPISLIAHSLGSAISANALSRSNVQVDQLVFLSSPNKVEDVFLEFKEIVGMNQKAYDEMVKITNRLLEGPLSMLDVDANVPKINYDELLIIHDKNDRILSYENSKSIETIASNSRLLTIEDVGHYKMLWSKEVISKTVSFLNKKQTVIGD
jgi:pimeloyl-ACP methyl ester carboxylesterase